MKGIIIAAGKGSRLKHLTADRPKSLLEINGVSILENIVQRFRDNHINDIAIITGYQADKIQVPGVRYYHNENFENNNILHSLMYARDHIDDDVVISYSDIWLENGPVEKIAAATGDFVISVDTEWEDYYVGRTDHPVSDAENVFFNDSNHAIKIGKHLDPVEVNGYHCGEFIGLFKVARNFAETFCKVFDDVDARLSKETPFQNASRWESAYVTDIVQELIDRDYPVSCSLHQKQWAEIDTIQDYNNLLQSIKKAEESHGSAEI